MECRYCGQPLPCDNDCAELQAIYREPIKPELVTDRLSGSECSTYGAYEPTRLARIGTALAEVNPRLWGFLAGTVFCAAVQWGAL